MARIGFIGLGNMGLPMARNLVKAGHAVRGFDLAKRGDRRIARGRWEVAADGGRGRADAEVVLTMLPRGRHVRAVYLDEPGCLPRRRRARS